MDKHEDHYENINSDSEILMREDVDTKFVQVTNNV